MSYGYSKGQTVQGDIAGADDSNRDTKIDFEEDQIIVARERVGDFKSWLDR